VGEQKQVVDVKAGNGEAHQDEDGNGKKNNKKKGGGTTASRGNRLNTTSFEEWLRSAWKNLRGEEGGEKLTLGQRKKGWNTTGLGARLQRGPNGQKKTIWHKGKKTTTTKVL